MSELPSFVKHHSNLQAEIKSRIIKACDGMFLLAKPHLDSLVGKVNPKTMQAALRNLPSGKDTYKALYGDSILRIKRQDRDQVALAKQVITWVAYAKRPLTTTELRHAIAVEVSSIDIDQDNMVEIELMVSVCAGLVTVDAEENVRFLHPSIQEYLEHNQKEWFVDSKLHITEVCTTYLSFRDFEGGFCDKISDFQERLRSHPFYEYAAHNWGYHAREAVKLNSATERFLNERKKVQASSQALWTLKRCPSQSTYNQMAPKRMTGLHLVAYFGIHELGKLIIGGTGDLDPTDTHRRTPLSYAAENGHLAIVKLLCEKGADVKSKSKLGRIPLSYAAENGYEKVSALLLKKGADIESEDGTGRVPLSYAAENGQRAVIRLLLESGANIDSKDIYNCTPLLYATESNQKKTVKILLDKDASIKAGDGSAFKLLSCAILNGNKGLVEIFLNKGAELESRDEQNRTLLSHAAENGDQAIVELLLKRGAKPDTKDTKGNTPWSYARDKGHKSLVKLLSRNKQNNKPKD